MEKKEMIKHNINFLEYPLWFQSKDVAEESKTGFTWEDREGYVFRSGYKIPTKTDAIFLLYFLLQSQKKDYQSGISISRYQVLKDCDLSIDSKWYDRLQESLDRWLRVDVAFKGKFYDGKEYQHIAFHIIDSWSIDKETKLLKIDFSPNFLKMMMGKGFFKYINFKEFKALHSPLATRLYEILCKNFAGRVVWEIDAVKMAEKIPMKERFPADIVPKIQTAVSRINKHTTSNFHLDVRRPERGTAILSFHKLPDNPNPVITKETHQSFVMPETDEFKQLVFMIPPPENTKKTILEAVARAFRKHGFKYVARNIGYTTQQAITNYRAYLDKALKGDLGKGWAEDQEVIEKKDEIRAVEQKLAELKNQQEVDTIRREEEKTREVLERFACLAPEEQNRIKKAAVEILKEPMKTIVQQKQLGWERTLKIAVKKVMLAEVEQETAKEEV